MGSAPAYINYNLAGDALVHCLKVSGAKLVMVDAEDTCRARIEESRDRIESELGMKVIILDETARINMAATPPERPDDTYRVDITPDSPMALYYTRFVIAHLLASSCAHAVLILSVYG